MKELISKINLTYNQRMSDINLQKKIWKDVSKKFSPNINLYRHVRPSTIIAQETGDLALAVLWIVQTALTRPILHEISLKSEEDNGFTEYIKHINDEKICALAHSEKQTNPVIIKSTADKILLSGKKNFITAGTGSDIILITCREIGEEKISKIAIVDTLSISVQDFSNLSLNIFPTVNHTSLSLKNLKIENNRIATITPLQLRKCIKRWSVIEKALIYEAYISYLLYCVNFIENLEEQYTAKEQIQSLFEKQSSLVNKQIEEAVHNEKVDTANIDRDKLSPIVEQLKAINEKKSLTDENKIRLNDLFLFDLMIN